MTVLAATPCRYKLELAAHRAVIGGDFGGGAVDEVQQRRAALDVAEEAVAEAGALVRPLDQPRNIGDDHVVAVQDDDAELGAERGEGIVGDLRPCARNRGQEGRLAGVGQADQPDVGDQPEA